ncbi:MAG: NADH-quinone oxidoreductase subunit NuoH [Actinomycetota bacterium]
MLAQATSIVDSTFSNFWLVLIVKAAVVVGFFLVAPMMVGYAEHKTLAHMQSRLGPMEAGKFHGWAQLVADGVKFIQKEDIIPKAADPVVFTMAPAVAMIPYIVLFVVIPFGPTIWALNLDVGVFFALAITGVSVIGVLMAGWASANKFSLIGAIRAAAQLIAYELPLILATAAIVMQVGSMSMVDIVEAQGEPLFTGLGDILPAWNIFYPWQALGFIIFMTAALAELTRPPFDMPVADSEIIFGAYTEYTGLKFAFFLLAEYGGIVALSALASILYLGGYEGIAGIPIPPPIWMLAKIGALSFFIIWLRATYPRLREDQLQRFAWVVLIPLALALVLVTAVIKVL